MITINIPFEPVAWAAPKVGKGYAYDPREKDKRAFRYLIKEQYQGPVLDEPVAIKFIFACSPPKSASKKKRELMLKGEIIPTKSDCTNYQKLYEDCLKGIVIKDDRNVEIIHSQKVYDEKGCVVILIFTRDSSPNANCS